MKKHRFLKFIIALVLVFGITLMQHTPAAIADVPLDGAGTNTVHIDATYDPASRTYSIAGMSFEQLQAMNLPQFDDSTWNLLGLFDELSIKIIGNEIQIFTNETKLVSMAFDESARIFIYDIFNVFLEGSRIAPAIIINALSPHSAAASQKSSSNFKNSKKFPVFMTLVTSLSNTGPSSL